MKTTTFAIDEIYASAWENAIKNVGKLLYKDERESMHDWSFVQDIATKLNIRFDLNGNIVNDEDEIKDYRRTSLKVEVTNGTQHCVRTVYKDIFGKLFFKDGGKWNHIFRKDNGIYTAAYYNRIEFIKEETI